ncbi:SGNH/GDSL hydrolase family protein [Spirosoma flavum]|uniref:SGNH/GDSL hydrolase family protein n=1 Tax=Spirosoma flavum TaxID=2048557 RepID=A0ABW6APL7_9BACT
MKFTALSVLLPSIPQSALELPVDSRLVYIGDSITANGFITYPISGGTAENNSNAGFSSYANLLSGSRFFVPYRGNKGVPGDTTSYVIARMSAVLALKPTTAILEIGTNDISSGLTASAIQANLQIIYDGLKAINCIIIQPTILQRFSPNALTAPQEIIRQTVNAWIKARTDITPVDAESMNNSTYFADGLHPNVIGAYTLGSLISPKLAELIANQNIANTLFPDGPYINVPLMAGLSGTKNTATGTVANGWGLNSSNAGGSTVVGSKSTEDKQIITVSGNYTGTSAWVELLNSNTVPASVAGDLLEGVADIEILSDMTGIAGIDVICSAYNSDYSTYYMNSQALSTFDLTANCPLPVGRYTLRTAVSNLAAGAVNFNLFIKIILKNVGSTSSPVSGTFKIWRAGIRKIN